MLFREWFRPPRQVLLVFVTVAAVSAVTLGTLAWLLVSQDQHLERQRQQERVDHAADRATAIMLRVLTDVQARLGGPPGAFELPADVFAATLDSHGLSNASRGLLYHPTVPAEPEGSPELFAPGERLELVAGDLVAAAATYRQLSSTPALATEAFAHLARVQRKRHEYATAMETYRRLETFDPSRIAGLPAGLVARVGRIEIAGAMGQSDLVYQEAGRLQSDLQAGRWALPKSTYEFYRDQASAWSGVPAAEDPTARSTAVAVEWLWESRHTLNPSGWRLLSTPSGAVLAVWRSAEDRVQAAIAGPRFLAKLGAEAVAADLLWTMTDAEGRPIAGDPPPTRAAAIRTAAVAGLPWTLHVFTPPAETAARSPRVPLLLTVLGAVAVILLAGWYFTFRSVNRELKVAELQTDFVAAVSHEFRSPLTSLSHIADLLSSDRLPTDAAKRQAHAILVRDTDRLKHLVEGVLDLGRFEKDASAFHLEPVDVAELINQTASEFQARIGGDVHVDVEMCGEPWIVSGDREALARALWNLLDNAVKYSPDRRTVWIRADSVGDAVSVAVRDEGIGIPAAEQRAIFDRFVRGRESKERRIRGTGIGLSMIRQIMRAHNGTVRVASDVGKGSTFTLTLPIGPESTASEPRDLGAGEPERTRS